MVPNVRFIELLTDIEPSTTTKSNASSAHTGLRAHLRTHEKFKKRWIIDFLAGSYSRDTAIRPVMIDGEQERPDVDIIVETSYTTSDTPETVLNELCDALEDGYIVERINKRSVRVTAWNAVMDVVPVIKTMTGYLLPDRDTGGWKATNPPKHDQWATEQNALFDLRFKKFVKLLKWWRRENPTSKRPKGFVLEMLVSKHAPRSETHFGEAFTQLLEGIHTAYSTLAKLGVKPQLDDPAIPGNDILAKVTIPQWQDFIEKVRVHAGYARSAQTTTDMKEATRLWRKIFGDRFKDTADVGKAVDATNFASAAVPTADYMFSNLKTAPNKPRGFA